MKFSRHSLYKQLTSCTDNPNERKALRIRNASLGVGAAALAAIYNEGLQAETAQGLDKITGLVIILTAGTVAIISGGAANAAQHYHWIAVDQESGTDEPLSFFEDQDEPADGPQP